MATSILSQTTQLIRQQLQRGHWGTYLPSERTLTAELGVSRTTLRKALRFLTEQGYLSEGQAGKKRTILTCQTPQPNLSIFGGSSPTVAWLSSLHEEELPRIILRAVSDLRALLNKSNITLKVVPLPPELRERDAPTLSTWLRDQHADIWLLQSQSYAIRKYFIEHKYKCICLGKKQESEPIPSISVDITATGLHATKLLQRHKHQHIALVLSDTTTGDNQELSEAFLHHCEQSTNLHGEIIVSQNSAQCIVRQLEALFLDNNSPPTAVIADLPQSALCALTWLQQHHFKVPQKVSLVALRTQPSMDNTYPQLASYHSRDEQFPKQVSSWVHDILSSGTCPTTSVNLIPEYIPGHSISSPPN